MDLGHTNSTLLSLCCTLCLVLGMIFYSGLANTETTEERAAKAEELNMLRQRIRELREDLEQTRSLHDSIRAELRQLERDISQRVRTLSRLKQQLRQQKRKLVTLKKKKSQFEAELDTQQVLLAEQVRAAYAIGRQEFVKLVLNQEDPAVVGRAMTYYDFFNRARSQRITAARQTITKLETVKSEIIEQRKELKALQLSQQNEKSALEKNSRARAVVVARLNAELQNKGDTLARWLEDEKQLHKIVEAITEVMPEQLTDRGERRAFASLKGRLAWPTGGRIKALFGKPREGGQVNWNGVIISAEEGKDVRAISHGRVAYADWLRGYGLLIIIDHGDGYMSLYGHNQSLFKETGDWVEAGEVIGNVGKSGGQQQAGLYFEIRHRGKPRDPSRWCKT